ncbi:MAG: hypothetical protein IKU60_00745 [Clostridia bacterium]|nr:hypothetical protein [Clostridia bacterium]
MRFKGTLFAIIVIILLAILSRFGFNESFERKDVLVEPTERPTFGVLENTYLSVLPTEN